MKTLGFPEHNVDAWEIIFHDEFAPEYREFPGEVQIELAALLVNLRERGPLMGRPFVDTLNGSSNANMKELRFKADGGVWRVAFAFDPQRQAVLLVGGNKSGISERRFYRELIRVADERFERYLKALRLQKGC